MKFYEAFGLEPALSLDVGDLKERFYERSRQWHPDKFSRASADDQQKALDMTSMLNNAFRTLKDPVARAEYFLKEKGLELSKEAPPELLEEVFELNMAIEEAAVPELTEFRIKFVAMRDSIDESVAEAGAKGDLEAVRDLLSRRRYIRNLIEEVDNVLPN